ncbi:hypothetical protein HBI88_069900 [Parastagonospora nodorum]|nr:hypothetical protein HBI96_087430 [Parastagonospora nodorum]KAH5909587.1 hypothetical protein HBI89_080190 [Parastagonospora nodorum]KAH5935544.1 hypothetical protein HBI88_069900 [Parastagonospora nodorum]KAH5965704.1 hypothetical protein HBI87_061420 [Parastagonospora nodorum]KAH5972930.1 hypothetical protein HBI85_053390 [Parastagonospora nodorum]
MLFLTSCATESRTIYNRQLAGELATAESITIKEPLIARGNISNAAIQTILFAFIINYILETSSRTYNKAY